MLLSGARVYVEGAWVSSHKRARGGARGSGVRARGFIMSWGVEPEAMVYEPEAMVQEPEAMVPL